MEQKNGQRISVMKGFEDKEIKPKCEVFIGKTPREIFEDQILPKFEMAGRVQKLRLMMDFSGTNRGFAFITYMTPQEAQNAVNKLNGINLVLGDPTKTAVILSFDNKGLHFGGLPANCAKGALLKCLKEKLVGVEDVRLFRPRGPERSAEVFFKNHDAACVARRLLVPGNVTILDCAVTVDWAKPERPSLSSNERSENRFTTSPVVDLNNNQIINSSMPIDSRPPLMPHALHSNGPNTTNQITPLSPDNILGVIGQEILNNCHEFEERFLVIYNIDLASYSDKQIQRICEIGGRLKVLSVGRLDNCSVAIEYGNQLEACFMLEPLALVPACFEKLALKGRSLQAYPCSKSYLRNNAPGFRFQT